MLSFRAWLALLLFYLMYLLLGGYIFYLIEEPNDCINVQKNYNKSQELIQLVEDIRNGKKNPYFSYALIKGCFYSEGTDAFIISSNRQTLIFS